MSVVTGSKGEKGTKKFQSLNINTLYQGSALKPLQKSIPQKHGLQSLGKVPTARRAPANLPSLKAEHSGNDPTINLVPSGHGVTGGWTAGNKEENEPQKSNNNKPDSGLTNSGTSPSNNSFQSSSLSSKSTWGTSSKPKAKPTPSGAFHNQRSPLFGQDFPSLDGTAPSTGSGAEQQAGDARPSPPPASNSKSLESKYGPGPSLRPQNFPTWSFSGKQQTSQGNSEKEIINDKGNHGGFEQGGRNRPMPEPGSLKFDVGVNSPLLQQSGGTPFSGSRKSTPQRSQQAVLVNKPSHQPPNNRPRENLFQGSIIDNEKLKRMDDIDSTDDDWTRKDESFDYNKKIDSDEEEDYPSNERGHGNWTDQVTISSTSSRHSEPRDNFEGPQSYGGGRSSIKVKPTSHDNLSFLDDEDQRRTKKNEEVLKNIERAKRRRAEEEQKYRVVDDYGGRRSPASQYNSDYHSNNNNKRSNDARRTSPGTYENGVAKSASNNAPFGKFDVGGQTESDDSEPKRNLDHTTTHGGRGAPKQQSSVPPRFKRQGGELHNYKRSSPPKDRSQHFSGDADISADVRSSASRESAESHQSQEKDYGALFRQQSNNSIPSSGWGMRHQSGGSSDRCIEDSARFDELPSDQHHPPSLSQDESKRHTHTAIAENDDEIGGHFARGSGGRNSNRGDRKGRGGDKHDDTKHKGSNKPSDSTKERNQGKRDSVQSKSERGRNVSNRGDRGNNSSNHNNTSGRNHEGGNKRSNNDHKSQQSGNSRNQRGSSKKEEEFDGGEKSSSQQRQTARDQFEEEVSNNQVMVTSKETNEIFDGLAGENKDVSGWFAPRGQPSRRGRGGLATGSSGRHAQRSAASHEGEMDEQQVKSSNRSSNRRSHHDDWDESSSERSAGQNEERNKEGNRRGGEARSHGRKERSKKQGKSTAVNEHGGDENNKRGGSGNKHDDETELSNTNSSSRNKRDRGDRNNRDRKHDNEKDVVKRSGGQNERGERRSDRESKQIAFERRQNKLPPRLAKQKEQNRQSGGQLQPPSVTEAWGSQSNELDNNGSNIPPPVGGGVQWDPSVINQQTYGLTSLQQPQQQQHQSSQQQPSLSVGSIADFENRTLLIQRLRSEEAGVMSIGAEGGGMRLDATGLAVGSGTSNVGLASNMTEAFTSESRENAVQTIIFENTNFKGSRPLGNTVSAGDNEKIMFKLGQDSKGLTVGGFNQTAKGEDDLKLDFTFETADIPGSGEGKDGQGSVTTVSAHRPVSSSSVPTAVVPASSQPATADDLNMKIASVKKVWETLPSMSPVPGGGVGVVAEQSSAIGGPFSANEDKGFDAPNNGYDKDASASAKLRPQQQVTNQVQSHHGAPTQATHGQQQVQNQPIPHSVHSQLQQPSSSQLHHQSLLQQQQQQQASLDDRVLGRGNSANMAYNRLLGTGALPNLQSPPSILGQQPSLYQAFQIDPNRAVTNQLYPYAATGIGGQSLILPPSGSSLSAGSNTTNTADLFGPSTSSQFSRQFAAPPPTGTQTSTVMNTGLMSQSSLMTSSMKQSAASAGIGPIGTKAGQLGGHNAYQQGGIGSLPASATSPLIIPYDGSFVPRSGQTAFYQALASQQTTRQNNFGITGFPNQQSLMQQQMMRNQVPPQMPQTHYLKPDSNKGGNNQQRSSDPYNGNNVGLSGLQSRQFAANTGQHQQPAIKATATSLASMSLRGSVLGTSATTNGTAPTSTPTAQQTTSYSPTPIQRPPVGKGKSTLNTDKADDAPPVDVVGIKDKKEDN